MFDLGAEGDGEVGLEFGDGEFPAPGGEEEDVDCGVEVDSCWAGGEREVWTVDGFGYGAGFLGGGEESWWCCWCVICICVGSGWRFLLVRFG